MALYPPILASSMPAFDIAQGYIEIYFNLSSYNRADEIKAVQYSVRRQNSNVSVINGKKEIGRTSWLPNDNQNIKQLYKIQIPIATGGNNSEGSVNIQKNVIYRVQLRFVHTTQRRSPISSSVVYTPDQDYNCSQWSTVTIIKAIQAPYFSVDQFEIADDNPSAQIAFLSSTASFIGLYQAAENSNEPLRSWRMRLLNSEYQDGDNIQDFLINEYSDTGVQIISAYSYSSSDSTKTIFEGNFGYDLQDMKTYKLLFEIETKNGYKAKKIYNFQAHTIPAEDQIDGALHAVVNQQQGYIRLYVTRATELFKATNYVLRRTSSKSNYLNWEDIYNFQLFSGDSLNNFSYIDFTAESGTMYKYSIQIRDTMGRRGNSIFVPRSPDDISEDEVRSSIEVSENEAIEQLIRRRPEEQMTQQAINQMKNQLIEEKVVIKMQQIRESYNPSAGIMGEWEHAFLVGFNKKSSNLCSNAIPEQLKLKYDFQISSYQTNISENKTDTIGSKYPFIRRNGNMYYRSFQCSGIITGLSDERQFFTNDTQLYGSQGIIKAYQDFQGNIDLWVNRYDYTYERKFREKVEQFLYDSQIKLYKSMQQGNIFVKLMDISLTPKTQLGRLIYSFSATAYQVEEVNIQNLNKYNFLSIGSYATQHIQKTENVVGQISSWDEQTISVEGVDKQVAVLNKYLPANVDILQTKIADKHLFNKVVSGDIVTELYLKWLRIEVYSPPYLIYQDKSGNLYPVDDLVEPPQDINKQNLYDLNGEEIKRLYQMGRSSQLDQIENIYLGHLFVIDGVTILISPPNNIYELKDPGLKIALTSSVDSSSRLIYPLKDTLASIDYMVDVVKVNDTSLEAQAIIPMYIFGSIEDSQFNEDVDIVTKILYKHRTVIYENTGKISSYKGLTKIDSINIDAQPNTVLLINGTQYFIIDETGQLLLEPIVTSNSIDSCKIIGILLRDNQLRSRNEAVYDQVQEIENPKMYDSVRLSNNTIKIFYNRKWRDVQELSEGNYIVKCQMQALIQYNATGMEEVF